MSFDTSDRRFSPSTPSRSRAIKLTAVAAAAALVVAGASLAGTHDPAEAAASPATLVVHANQPFRSTTHVADGALYGLASNTEPSTGVVSALHPNEFVQMAPGGSQLPNGEPSPAGDALVVAPSAARAGAKVVVRMPDWYPNFPYKWVSWTDWLNAVDTQVKSVQASGAKNIAAYELWNEPDWTWNAAAAGTFEDGWTRTYREVRSLDPKTPIQGPSFSDNISDMQNFLENAVKTNTVPDIISWHELETPSKIAGDVATVEGIEKSLGISPRPIDIEEYATTSEVGVPGSLVQYIAKFERLGVHSAELAFWNHYGTLGDLLTDTGAAPNGAYWLYKWYGDMSGKMVTTTPPSGSALDAAASVASDKKSVDVIAGGGSGATSIRVDGLNALHLGDRVNVKLEYTPSYGRTTAVTGPITISNTQYRVGRDGSISVPVVMNPAYGYHVVVSHATGKPATLAGTYTVTNVNSGRALGTAGSGTAQGTPAEQQTPGSSTTQTWKLIDAGSGLYKIENAKSGRVLGIQNGSTNSGAPALIWGDNGTSDHLWQFVPDGSGHYRIANYGTGKVLAISGMSTATGAAVVQWTDGAVTTCAPDGSRPSGEIGNALDFCGSSSYVSIPSGVVSALSGDYTVSGWVNPSSNTTWSRFFDIGTGTNAYMFLTLNSGTGIRYAITASGAGGEQLINGAATLPLNQWSLVTVTVSGTTGTLYVNGQAVGTNTNITVHPSALGNTANNYIGKSQYAGDPALNASVDDFNIYDRALSAAEVSALASGTAGDGDVLHYTFDEPSGTVVADSSGKGRDGTLVISSSAASTSATNAATADHFWTLRAVRPRR